MEGKFILAPPCVFIVAVDKSPLDVLMMSWLLCVLWAQIFGTCLTAHQQQKCWALVLEQSCPLLYLFLCLPQHLTVLFIVQIFLFGQNIISKCFLVICQHRHLSHQLSLLFQCSS